MWSFERGLFSQKAPRRWWPAFATEVEGHGLPREERHLTDPTPATAAPHSRTHPEQTHPRYSRLNDSLQCPKIFPYFWTFHDFYFINHRFHIVCLWSVAALHMWLIHHYFSQTPQHVTRNYDKPWLTNSKSASPLKSSDSFDSQGSSNEVMVLQKWVTRTDLISVSVPDLCFWHCVHPPPGWIWD